MDSSQDSSLFSVDLLWIFILSSVGYNPATANLQLVSLHIFTTGANMIDLTFIFRSLKGGCYGNQILGPNRRN